MLSILTMVAAVGLFLLAAGMYVLAAETAGLTGSNRLDTLQVALGGGGGMIALLVVQAASTRRR